MIGIEKRQLEANLLARLEEDDDLWASLVETLDWTFHPDASCDDGIWCDDSRWLAVGDLLGYRVEIIALPEKGYRYGPDIDPPIGAPWRVEVAED